MANVRFDNITVRYGSNTVLDNFSLEVESGKIVCLVGPSGCGKTTVTCALLSELRQRGLKAASFKCGPDYIDPMFHKKVISLPSYKSC